MQKRSLAAVEAGAGAGDRGFSSICYTTNSPSPICASGSRRNCLRNHTTNSCLLPIRGDGIHTLQEGSRRAIEHYTIKPETSDLAT